jgi:NADH:ubiquinone oxidoreductase subunit E
VAAASEAVLTKPVVRFIRKTRDIPHPESQLIAALHKVQEQFGYLGQKHLDAVAQLMQIPAARVTGVATFYHFFRLQPRGRFVINVCLGTACYVKGAERVADRLRSELGVDFGGTSADGVFSLEGARCLGTCGIAPCTMIAGEVIGPVTADQIPAILERYRKRALQPEAEKPDVEIEDEEGGEPSAVEGVESHHASAQ